MTSVCFYVQLLEFLASSFFLFLELSLTRLFVINSSSLSFVHVSYFVDFYVPYFYSSTSFITPLSVFLSVRLYMLLPFFRELEPRWLFAPSFVRIIGLNRMFIFFSYTPTLTFFWDFPSLYKSGIGFLPPAYFFGRLIICCYEYFDMGLCNFFLSSSSTIIIFWVMPFIHMFIPCLFFLFMIFPFSFLE